ncbi:Trafficking protein particle complex 8, partial [Balamuthia mandrillaris]
MEPVCDLIRRTFVPVVLVICSEEAEKLCARNNRTLVELLDCVPFPPLQASIKAANDKVYQPRDFQFRFVELSHYSKSREVIAQELFDIVADRSAADLDHYGEGSFYKIRDRTDVPFFIKAGKGQEPTPWFINYRKHFLNSIGFHDHHEYFDYPIACVFAISSAEADHTNTFLKLYSPQGAPPLFQGGFSDPNISKFHLLLHDSRDFATSQAETAISNLRTTFGKDCHLLKLNSLPDAQRNEDGTLLAQQDWAELQQWVSTLTIKTVVPHLQGVMQRLEEQLSQTRKGIGFQVSSLLNIKFGRSKAKTASPPTRHGTSSGSAETEQDVINKTVRQLADLQFMCGMYDLAKENYRLLGIEYKSLKDPLAQRSYAGVLEMTALCIQMQHTTTARQVESNLEQAFLGYQRCNIAGPYMVRCALFLVETLKSKQAFYDASLTLKRCCVALHYALSWAQQQVSSYNSNNTYLCTALLEEQAAFCHLYTQPPGFRRFAYHLVTAAEHFAAVQQLKHAVRCCNTAYGVYEERGWSLIEDTLHFKLGRYQFLLGDVEDSLTFMKRLLQHSNQPAHIQNSYLREFLHIYQEALERRRLQEQFLMAAKQTTTSAPTTSQQSDATILSSSSSSH